MRGSQLRVVKLEEVLVCASVHEGASKPTNAGDCARAQLLPLHWGNDSFLHTIHKVDHPFLQTIHSTINGSRQAGPTLPSAAAAVLFKDSASSSASPSPLSSSGRSVSE